MEAYSIKMSEAFEGMGKSRAVEIEFKNSESLTELSENKSFR
jgi:hypothetical protein